MKGDNVVNILWSGGWDSTFRVLDLIFSKAKVVQPYYTIDSNRLSTGIELRAMKNIKQRLFTKEPKTEKLLLPTRFTEVRDIKQNDKITMSFRSLCEVYTLGSQYEWFARFADEHGIEGLELCVDKGPGDIDVILCPLIVQSGSEDDPIYELKKEAQTRPEYTVFRYFRFPLLYLSKLDTQQLSKEEGFDDFLELTWFCFRPRANGTPCGTCNPCSYAIRTGLGRRIPFTSRVKFYLMQGKKTLRNRCPKVYNFLRITKKTFILR